MSAVPEPYTADADARLRFDDDGGPAVVPPRQCGRCRQLFPGDPTLLHPPGALPQWWLCPPCRTVLLGDWSRTARRHAGGD